MNRKNVYRQGQAELRPWPFGPPLRGRASLGLPLTRLAHLQPVGLSCPPPGFGHLRRPRPLSATRV
jgi:hypothetical protein